MSTTTPHLFRRTVLIGLIVALLMTTFSLILAPGVSAASDAAKTETNNETNIGSNEDNLLTQRAIMIDEARKEAKEVVSEQIAIQEAKAATEAPTEAASGKPQSATSAPASAPAESQSGSSVSESADDYGTAYTYDSEDYSEGNAVSASYSGDYLLDIANPDPSYVGYSVSLNDEDRDMAERILMGEAGGEGYIGMALVAQCIRDTYVNGSYSSIAQLLKVNGYYGSTSITPSQTAKDVVNYIFDQGGSAVQHNIRIFYATNMCSSSWHEAQDFVVQYNYVRFFNY
ncbi:MAG TPA: hypothetical protein DCY72_01775 [Ruminococcaceae bacterium]|nr:hypothetical protein [Oscillospiraceae bacterium]